MKKTNHGIVVIVIYVDDLIITGDSNADISNLKKLLKQKFEMMDLGELRYFLDIEVIQSLKGIWLLQRYHYVQTHSGEFDLHDHHKAIFELCGWSDESIHANTTKATFGCSEAHIEVHKTYLALWNFL